MNRSQMRRVMKEVAKNNNVSVAEVRREMKIAIAAAYEKPTPEGLAVPRKGAVPTPQELIGHAVEKVKGYD